MKPLLIKDLSSFVNRFGNFIDSEIRSINVISATTIEINIACQDSARDFDWLSINLELNGVTDAKLTQNSKLSLIDMNDGISFIDENNHFAFGIGNYDSISGIKNAVSYIICSSIKYEENQF